jgi:hypothetical protein
LSATGFPAFQGAFQSAERGGTVVQVLRPVGQHAIVSSLSG